jgi:hypothetical protein
MSRPLVAVRPISGAEAQVIERTLSVAATTFTTSELIAQVHSLRVVGRCECGCASVDFRLPAKGQIASIVADAVGKAPDGERLGVIIWALDSELSGLEVYSYSETPATLPVVGSIQGYDGAGSADAA